METKDGKSPCSGRSLKFAMCQMTVGEDKTINIETARSTVKKAAAGGAELISLPECWNSPYATSAFPVYAEPVPETAARVDPEASPSTALILSLAKELGIFLIGGSIPEKDETGVYNTSIVAGPNGDIIAKHRKVHLFDIDVPGKITFKESETLSSGNSITVFKANAWTIGLGICYDIRFAEIALAMRERGAHFLVYPGAFNMTTGPAHWELLQKGRALDNQVYVAAVSPARNPKSNYAWGHSTVISPWGDVVATTEHEDDIVYAELEMDKVEEVRRNIPISSQKRHDLYKLALK